jgi:hypothetical protein
MVEDLVVAAELPAAERNLVRVVVLQILVFVVVRVLAAAAAGPSLPSSWRSGLSVGKRAVNHTAAVAQLRFSNGKLTTGPIFSSLRQSLFIVRGNCHYCHPQTANNLNPHNTGTMITDDKQQNKSQKERKKRIVYQRSDESLPWRSSSSPPARLITTLGSSIPLVGASCSVTTFGFPRPATGRLVNTG